MTEEKMISEWALEWPERQMQSDLSKNIVGNYHQRVCKQFVPGVSGIALEELVEKQV